MPACGKTQNDPWGSCGFVLGIDQSYELCYYVTFTYFYPDRLIQNIPLALMTIKLKMKCISRRSVSESMSLVCGMKVGCADNLSQFKHVLSSGFTAHMCTPASHSWEDSVGVQDNWKEDSLEHFNTDGRRWAYTKKTSILPHKLIRVIKAKHLYVDVHDKRV